MSRSKHEHDQAERFAQSVDRLLDGKPIDETSDQGYQADLALARRLSQTRYVPGSQFEARLRNRLLNQAPTREVSIMDVLRSLTRPMLVKGVAGGLLLGLLLAVSLAVSPSARAAAQRWFAHFVEVDSPSALLPAADKGLPAGDQGQPAIGPDGKLALPANFPAQPNIQPSGSLISLKDAQSKVSFTIRMPARLPDGYRFLGVMPAPEPPTDVKVAPPPGAPKVAPPQVASLIFSNAAGEQLMLSAARMDALASADTPLAAGKGGVQEVTVNQQPAQYVEGMWTANGWVSTGNHQLHWQGVDGVTYDLTSPTLGLKELLAVAESIK